MKNPSVSDIFFLANQGSNENSTTNPYNQDCLFSVNGTVISRRSRKPHLQPTGVFPLNCMGNKVNSGEELPKTKERLSYDEQERAMNILTKIHRNLKTLRLKQDGSCNVGKPSNNASEKEVNVKRKLKLMVKKSEPDFTDLDYLLDLIKHNVTTPGKHVEGAARVRGPNDILSSLELRFMATIMKKQNAMDFFQSRLQVCSAPSSMCRNPITGNGMDDYCRAERKRGFDSVVKLMETDQRKGKRIRTETSAGTH